MVALTAKGDKIHVRVLQKRIMDCCIDLVSTIFSNDLATPADISYRIRAIGLLLQPISSSLSPASEVKGKEVQGEDASIADYRSLWISFVLFRLKASSAWSMHPQWLTALQSIASNSPPLLTPFNLTDPGTHTPGDTLVENAAKGIFEKELSYNPILRSFLNVSAGGGWRVRDYQR